MKKEIREIALKKRKNMNCDEKRLADRKIFERLSSHPEVKAAKRIMVYVSAPEETDTGNFINFLLNRNKEVYVPVIEENSIKAARITSLGNLEKGSLNIYEPKKDEREYIPSDNLDLVIVPGVSFTQKGDRLGRGAGFYDKFLKEVGKRTRIIGLCYKNQIMEELPTEPHDIKVDEVITELVTEGEKR